MRVMLVVGFTGEERDGGGGVDDAIYVVVVAAFGGTCLWGDYLAVKIRVVDHGLGFGF